MPKHEIHHGFFFDHKAPVEVKIQTINGTTCNFQMKIHLPDQAGPDHISGAAEGDVSTTLTHIIFTDPECFSGYRAQAIRYIANHHAKNQIPL